MAAILTSIRYEELNWQICADLKVFAMVIGQQGDYTKYCCSLCL